MKAQTEKTRTKYKKQQLKKLWPYGPRALWPFKALASWGVFALILLTANFANAASQKETAIPRKTWSVLSTSDSDSSKVAELLAAALSRDEKFTIVSRDELQKVADEKFLQKLFSLKDFKDRAEILNLIKTDMLIVVTPVGYNRKNAIKCIVLERHSGLRLMSEDVSIENIDKAISVLIEKIKKCHKKYLNGIKYVVGIAPLISDNLTYQYDYMSDAYRELLTEMFLAYDGVAVCEVAEIKTLAGESELDGTSINRNIISVVITGKYIVSKDGKVHFDISLIRKNSKPINITKVVLSSEVADFFTHLTGRVLKNTISDNSSFSKDAQFNFLVKKAEENSTFGLHENAARLREAALLIHPEDVKLRFALLDDYYWFYDIREKMSFPKGISEEEEKRVKEHINSKILDANMRAFHHIEWLIQNKKINIEEAAELLRKHHIKNTNNLNYITSEIETQYRGIQFNRDKQIIPLLKTLASADDDINLHNLYVEMNNFYIYTINRTISTEKDFPRALYYFNNILSTNPDDFEKWDNFSDFFIRPEITPDSWENITAEQWIDFLHKLSKSDRKPVKLFARIGLLNSKLWQVEHLSNTEKKELLKKLLQIIDEWKKIVSEHKGGFHTTEEALHASTMYDSLKGMYRRLTGKEYEPHKRWKPKPKPNDWRMDPSSWHKHGTPTMLGKLRFKYIDLYKINGEKYKHTTFSRFAKGPTTKDIVWRSSYSDWNDIWELTSDYKLKPILSNFKHHINNVMADDQHIWVTYGKNMKDSIAVFDYSGKLLAELTSDKIPKHDWRFKVQLANNGSLFVVGALRPDSRVWIAKLTLQDRKINFKLFFQAKKQGTESSPADYSKDPHFVFTPVYVHLVKMKNKGDNFILIGRDPGCNATSRQAAPLAVNLKTLEVGILKTLYHGQVFERRTYLVSCNSVILSQDGLDNVVLPDNWGVWQAFKRRKIIRPKYIREYDLSIPFSDGTGFSDGHFFYLFARKAFRIDMQSGKAENLTIGNLPSEYRTNITDGIYSNTHGILIIAGGKLYQVRIVNDICWYPEEPKKQSKSILNSFIDIFKEKQDKK